MADGGREPVRERRWRIPAGALPPIDRVEARRLSALLRFERALWRRGRRRIAGVDEAGVGPLAGPVVAAAVILPRGLRIAGVDDSKALTAAQRERLAADIQAAAVSWAVGIAEVVEIDRLNIYRAGLLAMRRAVLRLAVPPDHLLVDARVVPAIDVPQQPIIRGDALSFTIAAASILAKTTRDALMARLDREFPCYGFAQHKGYPTPMHLRRLRAHGPCSVHRRSFAPVRAALATVPVQSEPWRSGTTQSASDSDAPGPPDPRPG